jgi:hypothetical protein
MLNALVYCIRAWRVNRRARRFNVVAAAAAAHGKEEDDSSSSSSALISTTTAAAAATTTKKLTIEELKATHFKYFLLLTYLVLPPVSLKQFQALDCQNLNNSWY